MSDLPCWLNYYVDCAGVQSSEEGGEIVINSTTQQ